MIQTNTAARRHWPIFGTRRNFLVNRRQQLRVTVLVVSAVLVSLVILNLVLYYINTENAETLRYVVPHLHGYIEAHHQIELTRLFVSSLVFLTAVGLISLLESHRTAGPAFAIGRGHQRLERGDYSTRLQLRRTDNLKELEESFNRLVSSLEARNLDEIRALLSLADRVEEGGGQEEASEIAADLRGLARAKQRVPEAA
jgi:HAMP domain-containing protein